MLGVCLVLCLPLIATLTQDGEGWAVTDFVLAAGLLSAVGVAVELAVRRSGNVAVALGFVVAGGLAGLLGQLDDAPGLILLGLLLIGSGGAIGVRSAVTGR